MINHSPQVKSSSELFFSGKCGNGLEIGERLDIMIDVAHAITYLHTYTGIVLLTFLYIHKI